jgi:hypothetical protein
MEQMRSWTLQEASTMLGVRAVLLWCCDQYRVVLQQHCWTWTLSAWQHSSSSSRSMELFVDMCCNQRTISNSSSGSHVCSGSRKLDLAGRFYDAGGNGSVMRLNEAFQQHVPQDVMASPPLALHTLKAEERGKCCCDAVANAGGAEAALLGCCGSCAHSNAAAAAAAAAA